ncbi:hypothetical protein KCU67_g9486, partial [Aureobasidium melanogenum]
MPLFYATVPLWFTISMFGAQFHKNTTSSPQADDRAQIFDLLLVTGACYVDKTIHDDNERGLGRSRVWISYWRSPEEFKRWFSSPEVSAFWKSLPDDAGFWRETLNFPSTRFINEVTQDIPSGVGNISTKSLAPLTEKSGYWGAYRDRLEEATAEEPLRTNLLDTPKPRQPDGPIRRGRFRMTKFPEHICYVIEGQDHSPLEERETKVWSALFDALTERWITNVLRARPDEGLLFGRLCHVPESGKTKVEPTAVEQDPDIFPELDFNRKIEILYYTDLRWMERVGRRDKTHVKLRSKFMEQYGPDGDMSHGDLLLWVELGVLKAKDIEAEYIGCYEATGFLAYDHDPNFVVDRKS